MIRRILLLASACGGVWVALKLLGMLVAQVGGGDNFHLTGEGSLLAIPVGMIGALMGALIGGLIFPGGVK